LVGSTAVLLLETLFEDDLLAILLEYWLG
jgi:hypothetical protein